MFGYAKANQSDRSRSILSNRRVGRSFVDRAQTENDAGDRCGTVPSDKNGLGCMMALATSPRTISTTGPGFGLDDHNRLRAERNVVLSEVSYV